MTGQLPEPGAETAGTVACRACSVRIPADALRCPRCSAMQKDVVCPHCGASAGASPHAELRYVCDVCGGPRAPVLAASIKSSSKELPHLRRAEAARRSRAGFRAIAFASGLLTAFTSAIVAAMLLVFGPSLLLAMMGLVVCGSVLSLTLWTALRAKARSKDIDPALDAAWISLATDVAQQAKSPLTARDLARVLSIDEGQAEQLLALLDVNDIVKSDFTEEGEIAYSSRLRVETDASPDAAAEEEAAEIEGAAPLATAKTVLD